MKNKVDRKMRKNQINIFNVKERKKKG